MLKGNKCLYFVKCSEPVSEEFWKTCAGCSKMLLLCVYVSSFQLNKGYFATPHGYFATPHGYLGESPVRVVAELPLACLLFNLNLVQANTNFIFIGSDYI